MGMVLLLIVGLSIGTYSVGLSAPLGAFLAGLMVAETPYRHSISVDLHPFRGLLVGLFFMTVGMQINIAAVLDNVSWLIASVAGLACIKAGIMFPLLRAFGIARPAAAETSVNLAHGGEFAFVILGMAMYMDVIPETNGQFMLLVAALSMFLVPVVTYVSQRVFSEREQYNLHATPDSPTENHALIIGFGRFGQEVARALNTHHTPYIAIEKSARQVEHAKAHGFSVYHGDGSHCAFLDAVGLSRARLVVIALESPQAALQVLTHIRMHYPSLPIFARARDAKHAAELKEKNSCVVIEEGFEAALELATTILRALNIPESDAEAHAIARREEHYNTLHHAA
jgi:CPA2 family monovalent cation:H+ antiporter-2